MPFGNQTDVLAKVTHGIADTTHRHQECSCCCEPPINSILLVVLIVRGRLGWVILRASTHIAHVRGTDPLGLLLLGRRRMMSLNLGTLFQCRSFRRPHSKGDIRTVTIAQGIQMIANDAMKSRWICRWLLVRFSTNAS